MEIRAASLMWLLAWSLAADCGVRGVPDLDGQELAHVRKTLQQQPEQLFEVQDIGLKGPCRSDILYHCSHILTVRSGWAFRGRWGEKIIITDTKPSTFIMHPTQEHQKTLVIGSVASAAAPAPAAVTPQAAVQAQGRRKGGQQVSAATGAAALQSAEAKPAAKTAEQHNALGKSVEAANNALKELQSLSKGVVNAQAASAATVVQQPEARVVPNKGAGGLPHGENGLPKGYHSSFNHSQQGSAAPAAEGVGQQQQALQAAAVLPKPLDPISKGGDSALLPKPLDPRSKGGDSAVLPKPLDPRSKGGGSAVLPKPLDPRSKGGSAVLPKPLDPRSKEDSAVLPMPLDPRSKGDSAVLPKPQVVETVVMLPQVGKGASAGAQAQAHGAASSSAVLVELPKPAVTKVGGGAAAAAVVTPGAVAGAVADDWEIIDGMEPSTSEDYGEGRGRPGGGAGEGQGQQQASTGADTLDRLGDDDVAASAAGTKEQQARAVRSVFLGSKFRNNLLGSRFWDKLTVGLGFGTIWEQVSEQT